MYPNSARIIPASTAHNHQVESFPYFAATFTLPISADDENGGDEKSLSAELSSPEEDVQRLASVDQIIHEKLQMAEQQSHDGNENHV